MVGAACLGRRFTFQQTTQNIKPELQWKGLNVFVLEWPGQSPDLNPIKTLWQDLKTAVYKRSTSDMDLSCSAKMTGKKINL